MAIDDPLEKFREQIEEDLSAPLGKRLAGIAASVLPGALSASTSASPGNAAASVVGIIGSAISVLLTERATKLVTERFRDMVSIMARELKRIESKIDVEYVSTEQFLTLLVLSIDQLQVAHDREKVTMLAAALTNSCRREGPSEQRKELFVRAVRELTPSHVGLLREMRAGIRNVDGRIVPIREICEPSGEELMLLQNLAGFGLVEEFSKANVPRFPNADLMSQTEATRAISDVISKSLPKRCFCLGQFGSDFLDFISAEGEEPATNAADL